MDSENILKKNKLWAQTKSQEFLEAISKGQSPSFLWIGCADSRVSPNIITGTDLGEVFVHRNIANSVKSNDTNILSVLQYSVEALKVEAIVVCGHYNCGGVNAAFNADNGLNQVDKWIDPIRETLKKNRDEIESLIDDDRANLLVELNVKEQVKNLIKTDTIKNAWKNGDSPTIYGWVFDFSSGILKEVCQESP